MAYQLNYQANSFRSSADLSTSGPVFVKLDSTGRVGLPGDATSMVEGILENQPLESMVASVSYLGITKLTVDGVYPIGTFLQSDASGLGTQAFDGTNVSKYARAVQLQDSSASGDIVAVRLIDSNPYKTPA